MEGILEWLVSPTTNMLKEYIPKILDSQIIAIRSIIDFLTSTITNSPTQWNIEIYTFIKNISDFVILPIAGMILTFIMTYDLIQMIVAKNNMQDLPLSDIMKWIFKTSISVLIVSNTFPIIMGIFEVSQYVLSSATGFIGSNFSINLTLLASDIDKKGFMEMTGILICAGITTIALTIIKLMLLIIVYMRFIEIYLMCAVGSIPLATITSKEWNLGQNYLKKMLALAFQAFFMLVCVAIYTILINTAVSTNDLLSTLFETAAYSILLCFSIFKTGQISKSIFQAH